MKLMKSILFILFFFCVSLSFAQDVNKDDNKVTPNVSSKTTKKLQFLDMTKFDSDMRVSIASNVDEVEVDFYDKVSPNKTPERLQKWLTAVENNGGTINIEPPPNEMVPKSPFALISLLGTLWTQITKITDYLDNKNEYAVKNRNATITLERNPQGEVVITKVVFSKI